LTAGEIAVTSGQENARRPAWRRDSLRKGHYNFIPFAYQVTGCKMACDLPAVGGHRGFL
jgi:hypothetical protein